MAFRWPTLVLIIGSLAIASPSHAQYREEQRPIRLPEKWSGWETMSEHQDAIDFFKEVANTWHGMKLDREAEQEIRTQFETLNRQFEQGKKVVVFRVPRTEVSISQLGDTRTKQGIPVYVGSGDAFEEVHD